MMGNSMKCCSLNMTGMLHTWIHRICGNLYKTYLCKIKALENTKVQGGGTTMVLTLAWNLLKIDGGWGSRNPFALGVNYQQIAHITEDSPMLIKKQYIIGFSMLQKRREHEFRGRCPVWKARGIWEEGK